MDQNREERISKSTAENRIFFCSGIYRRCVSLNFYTHQELLVVADSRKAVPQKVFVIGPKLGGWKADFTGGYIYEYLLYFAISGKVRFSAFPRYG